MDADPDDFAGGLHLFNLERHTDTARNATPNSTGAAAELTVECSDRPCELTFRVSPLPSTPDLRFCGPQTARIPS